MTGRMLEMTEERQRSLGRLATAWLVRRPGMEGRAVSRVEVSEAEILLAGRPGLLDAIVEVQGRFAHMVLGLHRPGEEAHLMRASDDPALGLFDDEHGLGVVVDALRDADLAPLVLTAVTGLGEERGVLAPVSLISDDDDGVVLAFGDCCSLTVFPWLFDGPHPAVALLLALDEAGFNHLAAPLALWRRGGRDLGLAQELLAGSTAGWALALTSLRDLYSAGGAPEAAGGDFGPEARAIGTMTARMHLALDRAFGRRSEEVAGWVAAVESDVRTEEPGLLEETGVQAVFRSLRDADLRAAALHSHGDFHLGRLARTDQGWVVADCMPGGIPPGGESPIFRSPLEDVADLLWSLHRVAREEAMERDPTGRGGLMALAQRWETRNRRSFIAGYLATPGIGGLVPADRDAVLSLVAIFELARAARNARPEPR